jgi:hypothetical protein
MIRSVELTDNSVIKRWYQYSVTMPAWLIEIGARPQIDTDHFLHAIRKVPAEVSGVPLDGIERLRRRLRQQ